MGGVKMQLEVLINTTHGPVADSRNVKDRNEACSTLWAVFVDAFGTSLSDEHVTAHRQICRELQSADLPVVFRAKSLSVRLKA